MEEACEVCKFCIFLYYAQQGGILFPTNKRNCLPLVRQANQNAYICTTSSLDIHLKHKYTAVKNAQGGAWFLDFFEIFQHILIKYTFFKKYQLDLCFIA